MNKLCPYCKKELPIKLFNKHSRKLGGLDIYCKPCRKIQRSLHSDHNKEFTKRWRQRNPVKTREHSKQWRLSDRERYNKYQREWRKRTGYKPSTTPRKRNKANDKLYRQTHKEQIRHNKKMRKIMLKNSTGKFTLKDWWEKCNYHGWKCFYCKEKLTKETVTTDHKIPISKNGTNHLSNVVPCCSSCNSKKKDKKVNEFLGPAGTPTLS